ncbi:MAG: hypothetical protein LC734_01260 [Acidobacteria bacterium]|nr:hypothetical protein [Acidobacteriota bacterium]
MNSKNFIAKSCRDHEKGAALVMALLVSFMLMVASAGLILEVTTNTRNVTDITAERQAYDAAESGIQAAVNVLRDNITLPDDRLLQATPTNCTTPSTPELCRQNRIDYLKAITPGSSNLTTTGLDTIPRLSRWINYDATVTDRVRMSNTQHAYSLDVTDPDHTGSLVTYFTRARFYDFEPLADPTDRSQITYGTGANTITIKFVPQTSVQIDTTGGFANADFGVFRVTIRGTGAAIPTYNRFEITTRMTLPYSGVRVFRGYIEPKAANTNTPTIRFDSRTYTVQGSVVSLQSAGGAISTTYNSGPPPGFQVSLNTAPLDTPTDSAVRGTMSSPEPIRLLVRSTGFGPFGATKRLEAIIQKNFLNGLAAPATLTLIGPPSSPTGIHGHHSAYRGL